MRGQHEGYLVAYMMSTCSQSAPCSMVREHSLPSSAKSAERIDGAMIALGDMFASLFEVLTAWKRGGIVVTGLLVETNISTNECPLYQQVIGLSLPYLSSAAYCKTQSYSWSGSE